MASTNDKPIQHTQDHDLTHSMVHYLLTIHKLKENMGYARVTDIAKEMKITKGSVSIALTNLKKKKLVDENESKFLSLSSIGHEVVHEILSNRTLLFYFLKDVLNVNDETAHKDSCLMEHLVSDETREALFLFMRKGHNLSIDLSKYQSARDFVHAQMGDMYLAKRVNHE